MGKATLNVPGVDPARIECGIDGWWQVVRLDRHVIARFNPQDGKMAFDCDWREIFVPDAHAVMVAAFDHWRATGRLFPEPPPEPVDCVCGGKAQIQPFGQFRYVMCGDCQWSGPKHPKGDEVPAVASWNCVMNAVKAAKK